MIIPILGPANRGYGAGSIRRNRKYKAQLFLNHGTNVFWACWVNAVC